MFSLAKKSILRTINSTRFIHNIIFKPLMPDRYEEALDHLRKISYYDVPLYKAAGLLVEGKSPVELDNVYYNSMKEGVSTIALKDNKLVGLIINGILSPDAVPGAIEAMKKSKNESYKKMDYMFLKLLLDIDIFDRFGIDRALECRLLSTTREYRGTGLGKILVDKLTDTARFMNFPLIVGEAVNDYLWRLLVAEGWTMVKELHYSDYVNEITGESIFNVKPPHHILGVCIRIIDNKCKSKDPLPLPPYTKMYYPKKID